MEGPDDMPAHVRSALTAVQPECSVQQSLDAFGDLAGDLSVGTPHRAPPPANRAARPGRHPSVNEVCLVFNWKDCCRITICQQCEMIEVVASPKRSSDGGN